MFDKIKEAVNEQVVPYETKIKVSLSRAGNSDVETDDTIRLKYNVDVSMASWGIDSIHLEIPNFDIEYTYQVYGEDGEYSSETQEKITIDVSKLDIEFREGSEMYPVELDIWLKEDGSLDSGTLYIQTVKPTVN